MSARSTQAFEVWITRRQRYVVACNVVDKAEAEAEIKVAIDSVQAQDDCYFEAAMGRDYIRARYLGDSMEVEVIRSVDMDLLEAGD